MLSAVRVLQIHGFQTLIDLPESFEQDEGTNSRRAKHPEDIFVLTKEYISSTELRQKPLLVMTPENRDTYPLTTTSNSEKVYFETLDVSSLFFSHVKFWTTLHFKNLAIFSCFPPWTIFSFQESFQQDRWLRTPEDNGKILPKFLCDCLEETLVVNKLPTT